MRKIHFFQTSLHACDTFTMIMSCPALIRTIARQRSTSSIRHHYNYASPGSYQANLVQLWKERDFHTRGFTVGIGGPVGSGKTALVQALCDYFPQMGVVTNDIFTQEDAEFLIKHSNLPSSHVRAVETGGCPHSAIREDISINVTALEELHKDLMLCESGGDNLAVNFSRWVTQIDLSLFAHLIVMTGNSPT
jgi:ABC-type hemin transport system ATPase subunit